jgi:hypothetical protein
MITNVQLHLAIGLPIFVNAAMFGLLVMYMNARFDSVDRRFGGINQRFDDMRDLWRAELHRVEEVLDARLRHIEDARH